MTRVTGAACWLGAVVALGPTAGASASPFGVNVHLGPPRAVEQVADSGIAWARLDFLWAFVEPAEAQFDWSPYDAAVTRLERAGFRIYATISGTPAWATDGDELIGVPRNPDLWADFCYRAAARYRGRVAAWGFWNEPNLDHFWQGNRNQYLNLILKPGLAAVAAADPTALRCGPDLAHLSSADWDVWLASVLTFAGDGLDVVTHHVYPSDGTASSVIRRLDDDPQYPWEKPSVRRVLQNGGWWGRPVWLTETGRPSEPDGDFWQAQFYRLLVNDLFGTGHGLGWIDRVFFYELNDGADFPAVSWGMLGPPPDFAPKETLGAYTSRIAATAVDDAEVVRVEAPAFATPGAAVPVRVVLRNTGTTDWTAADGFALAGQDGPAEWSVPLAAPPAGRRVRPGTTVAIDTTVTVGSGTSRSPRPLRWRMVRPDGTPFGDPVRLAVTVATATAPAFERQPGPVTAPAGGTATFRVEVASPSPLRFQWQRNGLDLAPSERVVGPDGAMLTILDVGPRDSGEYRCLVSNDAGSLPSTVARLELLESATGPPSPRHADRRHGDGRGPLGAWLQLRRTAPDARSPSDSR